MSFNKEQPHNDLPLLLPENNIYKQMLEKQKNRPKEKADVVFNKLLAEQKKPKNPFDDVDSFTSQSMREIKPGPDYA